SGRTYSGSTSFSVSGTSLVTTYSVTVPAGVWDVRLCNLKADTGLGSSVVQSTPSALLPGGGLEYVSHLEPGISVFQNVTKDVTVQAPNTVKVSGSVSNLTELPPAAQAIGAVLVFGADSSKTQSVATVSDANTYETHLAPGTYSVSMFFGEGVDTDLDGTPDTYTSATSLLEIGSVTVGNSAVTKNFSVPNLITLTGTLQQPQTNDYSKASMIAADPRFFEGSAVRQCFPQVGASFALPNASTGAYSMPLIANQSYDLFGSVDTGQLGGPEPGQFSAPLIGTNRKSFGADSQLNVNIPAFPAPVTLSGKVTGPGGVPLSGASVTVTNIGNVTGAPSATFSATVETNAQGQYSVKVPPGSSYTIEFRPPVEGGGFGF
ncbi:MAG: carboxypeptidase regulatory-like domain-containing protein, partial [Acidobacteriota bacterium]